MQDVSRNSLTIMAAAAVSCSRMSELIAAAKTKLKENRANILACYHPWTPWALVELLDIPDCGDIPAELILYEAFVTKRNRGIRICIDEELQCEFKEVTKNGQIFFRNGKEYPVRRRRWVMEHKNSKGKVTAKQMWDFTVKSIQPNHLGILESFLRTRKISIRMKKMCRQIRQNHAYMLVDVPGMFVAYCIRSVAYEPYCIRSVNPRALHIRKCSAYSEKDCAISCEIGKAETAQHRSTFTNSECKKSSHQKRQSPPNQLPSFGEETWTSGVAVQETEQCVEEKGL